MAQTFNELDKLVEELTPLVAANNSFLIGIDGRNGIGKTHLAGCLASALKCRHIELDEECLDKNNDAYAPCIRCEQLRNLIEASAQPVIVDGVCLLDVAERCDIHLDAHIYVKRISVAGLWHDEKICLAQELPDVLIRDDMRIREIAAKRLGLEPPTTPDPLLEEIVRYHYNYRPVEAADYIFELREV